MRTFALLVFLSLGLSSLLVVSVLRLAVARIRRNPRG